MSCIGPIKQFSKMLRRIPVCMTLGYCESEINSKRKRVHRFFVGEDLTQVSPSEV